MTRTAFHSIEEALKSPSFAASGATLHVAGTPGPRVRDIIQLAQSRGVAVRNCSKQELESLAPGLDVRGVALESPESPERSRSYQGFLDGLAEMDAARDRTPLVLVLDSISDPHNVGAILRSADVFAVDAVIIPQRRGAKITDTVERVSVGASNWVDVFEQTNLSRVLEDLKARGLWIIGTEMDAPPLASFDARVPLALVMGSEGKGLSPNLRKHCDQGLQIPNLGHVDSLNVSVATGIFLYEVRRQQGALQ